MSEKPPSPEQPDKKQRVIEGLRSKGPEDPETIKLFKQWMDERIRAVESIPNSDRVAYIRAQIKLNIDRARVYFQGGQYDAALEDLEGARMQAEQEGLEDLIREIDDEMRSLEEGEER